MNFITQHDNRVVKLERMVAHQSTMIASLCGHLGTLEDALCRVQEEPPRLSTPTSDKEEEYMMSSSVIDLSDTDIVDLLGGPIKVPIVAVERKDSVVPETPEVMEMLGRFQLMRRRDTWQIGRLVGEGRYGLARV